MRILMILTVMWIMGIFVIAGIIQIQDSFLIPRIMRISGDPEDYGDSSENMDCGEHRNFIEIPCNDGDFRVSNYARFTSDVQNVDPEAQGLSLYRLLNNDLRRMKDCNVREQEVLFEAWFPLVHSLSNAFMKFQPVTERILWRGIKEKPGLLLHQYQQGSMVHWAAFSSFSAKFAVALDFAGPEGTILEMKCSRGSMGRRVEIGLASCEMLAVEGAREVLLAARMRRASAGEEGAV